MPGNIGRKPDALNSLSGEEFVLWHSLILAPRRLWGQFRKMTESDRDLDLTGKCLIAMPGMGDPRFAQSVVFLCAHSPDGAMGLIINQPAQDLKFTDLLEQLEMPSGIATPDQPIHIGGPVEHGRGFVLHSGEFHSEDSTLDVDDQFHMTATLDILEAIATGKGPHHALLALGYAGWGPGQLEGELAQNGWLVCDTEAEIVYSRDDGSKWERALATLGVDPLMLSAAAGRA